MKPLLSCLIVLLTSLGAPFAMADDRAQDVISFMEEYLRLWNAGDSEAITTRIMAFDAPHPFGTQKGLQTEFDRLRANGYSHSTSLGIDACWINSTQALAQLRYSRIDKAGAAMPPVERATLYFVKKTKDGLRINNLIPMDPNVRLECRNAAR